MKILVVPDSFKESLSAKQVANSINKGILNIIPNANTVLIPISDGGEGLLDAFVEVLNGKRISVIVTDPLNRKIQSEYDILGDGITAVIEMATASGLELLSDEEKNPLITSTFGTGQLIVDALNHGCTKMIIGIGGSATNDGGMGMVKALGGKFLDKKNQEIPEGGGSLDQLYKIDLSEFDKRIYNCEIIVACDVNNPLTGENGASFIYGGQKGGTPEQLKILDKNLINYASVLRNQFGIEVETVKGAAAAGGMGAGLIAFFNAELKSGIDLILETLEVEKQLKQVDLVITGEGKIDSQTTHGKAIAGIATLAKKHQVPVIAITGKIGTNIKPLYALGITSIFSIVNKPMELKEALNNTDTLIQSCVENIMRLIVSYKTR